MTKTEGREEATAGLDLSDRYVREMAEFNHRPSEFWTLAGALYAVCCDQCHQTWPCDTRKALEGTRTRREGGS